MLADGKSRPRKVLVVNVGDLYRIEKYVVDVLRVVVKYYLQENLDQKVWVDQSLKVR